MSGQSAAVMCYPMAKYLNDWVLNPSCTFYKLVESVDFLGRIEPVLDGVLVVNSMHGLT